MSFSQKPYHKKLTKRTDDRARDLFAGQGFETYAVPIRKGADGKTYRWEPEFGPVLKKQGLIGARRKLETLENFATFKGVTRDFSYVTASLNAPEGYIARGRFYYFPSKGNAKGKRGISSITREISDAATGIKPKIKSKLRSEYEAAMGQSLSVDDSMKKLKGQHWTLLPDAVRRHSTTNTYMTGLMLVERAGFEATDLIRDGLHTHLVSYAGSFDVCTTHDIRFVHYPSQYLNPIGNRFEAELEARELRSTAIGLGENEVAGIIEASMEILEPKVNDLFGDFLLTDDIRADLSKNAHATADMAERLSQDEIEAANCRLSKLKGLEQQKALCSIFDRKNKSNNRTGSVLISPTNIHKLSLIDPDTLDIAA